jgi:orotate phosphoribosyltransferase-like protein
VYENKLIDLYSDGLLLGDIAVNLNCSVPELIDRLTEYKMTQRSTVGRGFKYTQEIKDIVVDRYLRGIAYSEIAKEIRMSRSSVKELIDDSGFAIDTSVKPEEEPINWDDFDTCPECNTSDKVAPVGENYFYKSYKAANCTKCQIEWYRVKGGTKLVRYTNLD